MRAFRTAVVTAVVPVVLVLGGCTSEGSDTPPSGDGGVTVSAQPTPSGSGSQSPPPSRSGTPGASPTPRAPDPDETLVRVTRSGGFAGTTHSLEIKGDGSFLRLDGKARQTGTGKLSAAELEKLRTALREADFAHLPRVSMGETVYDGYTYAVVHGGYEVAAAEGSVPPGLSKVIAALPAFEAR
ncbi:hypothetical protein [Streptomyces sp. NPDC051183]|uniref:hypothetical protein n=1 Tax=unclassified Streptomyces TaxID=2593676 RepID=UPI00342F0C7A